ncbi:transcriptional regulator [Oleomonas cavernae]|uniref:Transcriptional regulator n=1 Tax=Oleomonas cavernae TaxID=2320859 RepID=A0A418WDR3_9PROT|nr:type II TA system antitoxin MqsA family protein [Oleomonas cavernae]RJF88128.1 transcriptional regulator [Oleomonas cavernae]
MQATRIHPETGAVLTRGERPVVVRWAGEEKTVMLPGWYPSDDGDGLHSMVDLAVTDAVLRELKAKVAAEVTAVRKALKLSQRKAGELLGGGARAFQKYEKGEVAPALSMWHLLKLLKANPAQLALLVKPKPRQAASARRHAA